MSKVTATSSPPVVDNDDSKITKCCPDFSPRLQDFDEKEITWKNKPFIKESTWCFFYIPLNFGGATTRACAKIDADDGASVPDDEFVMLSTMTSRWKTNILFSVAKDSVPKAKMVHLSGTFLTKVFEGPYSEFAMWIDEMKAHVKNVKGDDVVDMLDDCSNWYAYYATCPKCAKKYGKNYTVLFVKVA
jgi:hypothetical protein